MSSQDFSTRLLPLSAMAARAGIPAGWLRREAEEGRIPHLRAGARLLFDPETVVRMLRERAAAIDPCGFGREDLQ